MKIINKGNIYKKMSWFKEHEEEIYIVGCILVFICILILPCLFEVD